MASKKSNKRSSPEAKRHGGKPSRAPSRNTIQVADEWLETGSTKPRARSTIPVEDDWLMPELPPVPAPLKPPPLPRIDEAPAPVTPHDGARSRAHAPSQRPAKPSAKPSPPKPSPPKPRAPAAPKPRHRKGG